MLVGLNISSFSRLWRAAHDFDSSTEEEKDHDDKKSSFSTKKQNEELKKANKELWRRIEELQKKKTSIAKENAELKRKMDLSPFLPGNNWTSSFLTFQC